MTLPDHLAALRDEALLTSCESWAKRQGWTLSPGLDRAGPCPMPGCGGTDRFSIHTQKNLFRCRQCDISGEGVIKLVMVTQGVGFTEACEIITGRKADAPRNLEREAEIRRQNEAAERDRAAAAERYRQKARTEGYAIWRARASGLQRPLVLEYLRIRGLMTSDLMTVWEFLQLGQHDALPYMDRTKDGPWVQLACVPAMLAPVLHRVALICVMTVNPGFGGQSFLPNAADKIAEVRALVGDRPILIEADGGIAPQTAGAAHKAGADVLIAGSSVFGRADRAAAIRDLREAAVA